MLRPVLRAAAALLAVAASAAAGVVVRVPQDFPTIQEALDQTLAGDTVLISAGHYPDATTLNALEDRTLQGKGDVVLDVQGAVPAILVSGCTTIRLAGLHIVGGTENGVVVTDSVGVTLEKCRFEDQLGDGLHATGSSGLSCIGCQATLVTGTAFSFSEAPADEPCHDLLVKKCKTTNCGTGVFVRGDAPRIEKNKITHANASGIAVAEAAGAVVTKNTLKDQFGGIAIRLTNLSAQSEITSNKVAGSGAGLDLEDCTDTNLRRNKLTFDAFGMILTSCSNCLGEKNRISCGSSALVVQGCDHVQLVKNSLKGNGTSPGIAFTFSDDCTAQGNKLSGHSSAFSLGGDRDTVQGGSVSKALFGVLMDAGIEAPTVTGLKLKACVNDGFLVDGIGPVVSGCKISKCGGDGLRIFGSAGTISGNVVKKCVASGFVLEAGSTGNTLSGNKAKGSGEFDLLDESGGMNTVNPDNVFGTHSP